MTPFEQAMSDCRFLLRSNKTEPWPCDNPISQAVAYKGKFRYPVLARPLPGGGLAYLGRGAVVASTKWDPKAVCGGGIHGLPMGVGGGGYLAWPDEECPLIIGLVLSPQGPVAGVENDKAKTAVAKIIHVGSIASAAQFIFENGGAGLPIVGLPASTSGWKAPASTSGEKSMAIVAGTGRAQAGNDGCICMAWWDQTADRPRMAVGYIGETKDAAKKKLRAGTWYEVNNRGKFVAIGGGA